MLALIKRHFLALSQAKSDEQHDERKARGAQEALWNANVERVRALLASRGVMVARGLERWHGARLESTNFLAHGLQAQERSALQEWGESAAASPAQYCKYLPACSGVEQVMREAQVLSLSLPPFLSLRACTRVRGILIIFLLGEPHAGLRCPQLEHGVGRGSCQGNKH